MQLVEMVWLLSARARRFGGQSTVEYALVGALVVIAAAGALTVLGDEVKSVFANITTTLKGVSAHAP
jgi:Flp pilus assembly pilin Flp